jgi:hypothetical protein
MTQVDKTTDYINAVFVHVSTGFFLVFIDRKKN